MKQIYCSLVFLAATMMMQATSAAILNVNGDGILTGAQNVTVGVTLYDVEFRDNGDFYDIFGSKTALDADNSNTALIFFHGADAAGVSGWSSGSI